VNDEIKKTKIIQFFFKFVIESHEINFDFEYHKSVKVLFFFILCTVAYISQYIDILDYFINVII